MTRTRRFLEGLGVGYASQILLAIVGLWVSRFLLGRLGQEEYGLWLVATQLLAYLALTDLGIVALLPREVAYATGRESVLGSTGPTLPEVVGQTARIVFLQLPLVAFVGAGFWFFLPAEWESLRRPLALVIVTFVVTFPLRIPSHMLSGLQDFAVLGIIQTGSLLAGTIATVTLVATGEGLYALAIGWVVSQVLLGVLTLWRVKRRFPEALPRSWPRLPSATVRDRLGRGLWVSVSQISVVLMSSTDVLIIGKVLGAAAVVPYVCTAKLIAFLANQPQLLMQTAQPGLGEMKTGESRDRILRASNALSLGILMISGAIACAVMVVNQGFVRVWVGEEQWGGLLLTGLIVMKRLLGHWDLSTASTIYALGYERRLALVTLANGLLSVIVSVPLVRSLGPSGAVWGSLAGTLLVSLPANLSALSRETDVRVADLILAQWPWAWRFALVFATATAVAYLWAPTSVVSVALAGAITMSLYVILMLPQVLRPPLSAYVPSSILAALGRLPRTVRGAATS